MRYKVVGIGDQSFDIDPKDYPDLDDYTPLVGDVFDDIFDLAPDEPGKEWVLVKRKITRLRDPLILYFEEV